MKNLILFFIFLNLSAFDIDDFDKGIDALNLGDFSAAYEIFYTGCELNDELSCVELGSMYINGLVTAKLDNVVAEHNKNQIGLSYILKACNLGYINACGDIVELQKDIKIDQSVYKQALKQYDKLVTEYIDTQDLNSTNNKQ